jgi:galactose mutarotase-like enzyme
MIVLENSGLKAQVANRGAELVRLQDSDAGDVLWNGDPGWWTGHSPLLFPIVGRMPDDAIRIEGKSFPLLQHGFARGAEFTTVRANKDNCLLRLEASDETRARYPFEFALDVEYSLEAFTLLLKATVRNNSDRQMPFSFGFHPAFNWPLPFGGKREHHEIRFERLEEGPVRRTVEGLLCNESEASPVRGQILGLNDSLFERGVTIFPQLNSRAVIYGIPGRRHIRLEFPDCPDLGIWTKPGAGFVCIEPWHGFTAPIGFAGELATKPGVMSLDPEDSATFEMSIRLQGT